ncbi:MAG: hypothetical protein PHI83_06010 [Sphaerochaetaceae bacterium]|jgi:hypothetical protein|nr:hypothetical protein [Sphaerochaetaceae bacterium]
MSIFEAGMLIGFGVAWPMNIIKSLKSKTAAGKSVVFQWAVLAGYVCGIINKILYSRDLVLVLYIINFLMISVDTALYYRNRALDRQRVREGK